MQSSLRRGSNLYGTRQAELLPPASTAGLSVGFTAFASANTLIGTRSGTALRKASRRFPSA